MAQAWLGQGRVEIGEVTLEVVGQKRLAERLLRAEVVVERSLRDPGRGQDLVEPDPGKPLRAHQTVGGVEDALPGVGMSDDACHDAEIALIRPVV